MLASISVGFHAQAGQSTPDPASNPVSPAETGASQTGPRIKAAIPDEFADLAGEQDNPAIRAKPGQLITDMYVNGRFKSVVILEAEDGDFRILDPEEVASQLPDIAEAPGFAAALALPFSQMTDRFCQVGPATPCLAPVGTENDPGPVSAVILDPGRMRLDIYQPAGPKVRPPALAPSHPESRGVLLGLRGQLSSRESGGLSQLDGAMNYRLAAGQGPTSVFADGSLSASASPTVRRIGVQRYVSDNRFALGVVQSGGSALAAQSRLIGLEAGNEPALRPRADPSQSQPVLVFLNARALVSVLREGELIYSEFLEAGPQSIPTGAFPVGSYTIDIRIEPETGPPSLQSQFFSNGASLSSNFVWRANIGLLTGDRRPAEEQEGQAGRLTASLSVSGIAINEVQLSGQAGVIADSVFAEVSAGRRWEDINLSGTLRATPDGYGASLRAAGRIGPASLTSDLRVTDGNFGDGSGRSDRNVNFSTSVSLPVAGVQLNGFANVGKTDGRPTETSLGLNAARSFQVGATSGLLSANIQTTSRDTSAGIRLTLRQRIGEMSVGSFAAFNASQRQDDLRTSASYGAETSLRRRSELFGNPTGSVRLVSDDDRNLRLTTSVRAKTDYLQLNLRTLNSYGRTESAAFTGTAETLLVLTPMGYALSSESSAQSGMFVRRAAREQSPQILASATGGHRLSLGKSARFIPAPPFRPSQVRFRATGFQASQIDADFSEVLAFPGNVIPVTARIRKLTTVYGQIMQPGGEPLRNVHLRAGDVDFVSDDEGFFVADILQQATTIDHMKSGKVVCSFSVPPLGDKSVVSLGIQTCLPAPGRIAASREVPSSTP